MSTQAANATATAAAAPHPAPRTGPWRVGLLGAGYIADWHAKAIRAAEGLSLVAICDRVKPRADALAATHGIPHVFESLTDMLASHKIDAVHVLLPPEHHYAAASEILAAGLHVFLEKPMCLEARECEALVSLAHQKECRVGVSHNFLFADSYQKLRTDVRRGTLGRLDHVTINWLRELPQISAGPFDSWLLRDPRNVMLEIGPHVAAHLLDLVGEPDELDVRTSNPVRLPSGHEFFRRWQIRAYRGPTAIDVNCSFIAGFDEQTIHVRGTLAGATCDVGRNVYVPRRHTTYGDDLDRHAMLQNESCAISRQARGNLARYVLSKLKLGQRGSAYGSGIRGAIEAFYASIDGAGDPRISGEFGASVIALCQRIAAASGVAPASNVASVPVAAPAIGPTILVLGATGFIGKELVRQLTATGHATRVLVRSKGRLPTSLQTPLLDIVQGDASRQADLDAALAGITHVYHLARPAVKTWADYQSQDVAVTRLIAERCLAAGVKRLIYTGTIDSYYAGARAGTITEATPLDPRIDHRNLYARAKAHGEALLTTMHREQKLPVVIARPGIVIGRGGSPYHWGVGMWHHGAAVCRLWGDGSNPLPLVLVEDVAAALIKLLDAPNVEGESFNLVADPCLSGRDYIAELDRAAQVKLDVRPTAIGKFYLADMIKWLIKVLIRHPERRRPSYRDWESRTQRAVFDCSKTKRILNWQPTSDRSEIVRRGIVEPLAEAQ
jgi:predicted dehydrogenase/nucleoside-diphosphate-sugar epimerase